VPALVNQGFVQILKGEVDRAIESVNRSLRLSRESSIGALTPLAEWLLGHGLALSGRPVEGIALLQRATTILESIGMRLYLALALVD
jgi:hypothetical protein